MKNLIKKIFIMLNLFGVDVRKIYSSILGMPKIFFHLIIYMLNYSSIVKSGFNFKFLPVFSDIYSNAGTASGHYFHQDIWAAKKIYDAKPKKHLDLGSRIDGFIAHLLVFRSVDVIDIRTLDSKVLGLNFIQSDFTKQTDEDLSEMKYDSLSCLHAIEHFGLGRYGDQLNFDSWKLALNRIQAALRANGTLYISCPIGDIQSIQFNAHRIFNPKYFASYMESIGFELKEFSYIDDSGEFHNSVECKEYLGLDYGCGCFEFLKK